MDVIQDSIDPYMKLFSTVLKWQRAEKKWMDGDFLDLQSEIIEAEVRLKITLDRIFFKSRAYYIEITFLYPCLIICCMPYTYQSKLL